MTAWQWTKSLYRLLQRTVREAGATALVMAIDPVQFEKPYARRVEEVSKVHKSTLLDIKEQARLAWSHPAITPPSSTNGLPEAMPLVLLSEA